MSQSQTFGSFDDIGSGGVGPDVESFRGTLTGVGVHLVHQGNAKLVVVKGRLNPTSIDDPEFIAEWRVGFAMNKEGTKKLFMPSTSGTAEVFEATESGASGRYLLIMNGAKMHPDGEFTRLWQSARDTERLASLDYPNDVTGYFDGIDATWRQTRETYKKTGDPADKSKWTGYNVRWYPERVHAWGTISNPDDELAAAFTTFVQSLPNGKVAITDLMGKAAGYTWPTPELQAAALGKIAAPDATEWLDSVDGLKVEDGAVTFVA